MKPGFFTTTQWQKDSEWNDIISRRQARMYSKCGLVRVKCWLRIFWHSEGTLVVKFLERDTPINSEQHVQILQRLKQRIRRVQPSRKKSRVFPLHDSTRHKGGNLNHRVNFSPSSSPQSRFMILRLPPFRTPEGCNPMTRFSADDGELKHQRVWRDPTLQQWVWPYWLTASENVLIMKENLWKNNLNFVKDVITI